MLMAGALSGVGGVHRLVQFEPVESGLPGRRWATATTVPRGANGYATEAADVLLRWAFDTLDLNRVQAETDTRNVASARVLEKPGFVREGRCGKTAS
jgi:hypothetical protein